MEGKDTVSSRKAADQEEPSKLHAGSFNKYMQHKIQKLNEQFDNSDIKPISNIFQNVSIHVNGLTRPSHAELKQLMAQHGGRFNNYYSTSTVTHIICSNLPDAKVKQYESERNPTPVVRPEWIVDSIKAGKLLPTNDYILWQLHLPRGQRTLFMSNTTHKNNIKDNTTTTITDNSAGVLHENKNETYNQTAHNTPHSIINNNNNNITTTTATLYNAEEMAKAQQIAAQLRADCDVLKGKPKSSKDDPDFVQSFYRASRLHFIGRWKARLEALMSSSVGVDAPMPTEWTASNSMTVERSIIHIDMDCFFASVTEAGHPEFKNKPIAVCHSNSMHGSGEISSANYEARKYNITAGMFIAKAKELCPILIVVPYEFEKYEAVSEQVYKILLQYSTCVLPLSCDEAFLDVTGLGDATEIAQAIRYDIVSTTQCTASAGIGPNMLLARIATKKAKPNGVFTLDANTALSFLADMDVSELPGVGWSTKKKLSDANINTVRDIHARTMTFLQKQLGNKAGQLLWDFAHGRDNRRVEPPTTRKSIGAECNWGIRFENKHDPQQFLHNLSKELEQRMQQAGVKGKTITVKIKRKKEGWVEPKKFLGMGSVDNVSRSTTLDSGTSSANVLYKHALVLLDSLSVPYDEIRGLGLTVTKLDGNVDMVNTTDGSNSKRGGGGGGGGGNTTTLESFFQHAVSPKRKATTMLLNEQQNNNNGDDDNDNDEDGWIIDDDNNDDDNMKKNTTKNTTTTATTNTTNNKHMKNKNTTNTTATNTNTEQQPLPAFSQIDTAVLAELPPAMRREIESFYTIQQKLQSFSSNNNNNTITRRSMRNNASTTATATTAALNMKRYPRIDAFVKANKSEQQQSDVDMNMSSNSKRQRTTTNNSINNSKIVASHHTTKTKKATMRIDALTLSHIDPGVFDELPQELQREILLQLNNNSSNGNNSSSIGVAAANTTRQVHNISNRNTTSNDWSSLYYTQYTSIQRNTLPESIQQLYHAIDTNKQEPTVVLELLDYIVLHTSVLDDDSELYCHAVQCALQYYCTYLIEHNIEASRRFMRHVQMLAHDYEIMFGNIGSAVIETSQECAVKKYGHRLYLESLCF